MVVLAVGAGVGPMSGSADAEVASAPTDPRVTTAASAANALRPTRGLSLNVDPPWKESR
jgi:hypothetical protein